MLRKLILFFSVLCCISSVNAYTIEKSFISKNFAIFSVALDTYEKLDLSTQKLIQKEVSVRSQNANLLQTTAVIFPNNTKGLHSSIKEPTLGVITISNYDGQNKVYANFNKGYATDVGLYLPYELLIALIDNKSTNNLVKELSGFPLVITDIPVDLKTYNYKNELYITSQNNAFILDLNIVDSVYYDKEDMKENIKRGCTIDALTIMDRALFNNFPIFFAAHGSLNKINCN